MRSSRATRSRLPANRSRSVMIPWLIRGEIDDRRPRSMAISLPVSPAGRSNPSPTASPLTRHDDLADLAVDEDPVVELAAPAVEVGIADQPLDLRERRPDVVPSTATTQCRARAPSMKSTPRSSAVARFAAASAVPAAWRSTLSGSTASRGRGGPGCPGLRTHASGARRIAPDGRARGPSRRTRSSGSPCRRGRRRGRSSRSGAGRPRRGALGEGRGRAAASGPSQRGGWPVGSVGPKRDVVGTVSRIAAALARAALAKIVAESTVRAVPISAPSMKPPAADAPRPRGGGARCRGR